MVISDGGCWKSLAGPTERRETLWRWRSILDQKRKLFPNWLLTRPRLIYWQLLRRRLRLGKLHLIGLNPVKRSRRRSPRKFLDRHEIRNHRNHEDCWRKEDGS